MRGRLPTSSEHLTALGQNFPLKNSFPTTKPNISNSFYAQSRARLLNFRAAHGLA